MAIILAKLCQRAVFIDMGVGDGAAVEAVAQREGARRGWIYEREAGDLVLFRRLLAGDWETDFLLLEPGQQITMSYDDQVVGCLVHDPDGGSTGFLASAIARYNICRRHHYVQR